MKKYYWVLTIINTEEAEILYQDIFSLKHTALIKKRIKEETGIPIALLDMEDLQMGIERGEYKIHLQLYEKKEEDVVVKSDVFIPNSELPSYYTSKKG